MTTFLKGQAEIWRTEQPFPDGEWRGRSGEDIGRPPAWPRRVRCHLGWKAPTRWANHFYGDMMGMSSDKLWKINMSGICLYTMYMYIFVYTIWFDLPPPEDDLCLGLGAGRPDVHFDIRSFKYTAPISNRVLVKKFVRYCKSFQPRNKRYLTTKISPVLPVTEISLAVYPVDDQWNSVVHRGLRGHLWTDPCVGHFGNQPGLWDVSNVTFWESLESAIHESVGLTLTCCILQAHKMRSQECVARLGLNQE